MILGRKPEVEAFARRPDPGVRGALIHGQDRTSVRELARRILSAVTRRPDDPFDVTQLGAADVEPCRLAEELGALSLVGGRRVVHVRTGGDLGPRERVLAEAIQEHAADAYRSDAFLLIEGGALTKSSALRKAAEAPKSFASIALHEEDVGDLGRLAREALQRDGLRASTPVLERLSVRLPRERGAARQALEALALYLGPGSGETVTDADVDAVLGEDGEGAGAEVALSAFGGKRAETATALRRAGFLGEAGPALLRQLSMHAGRLARVSAAVERGVAVQAAIKGAGVFWKQEQTFLSQVPLWRPEALDAVRRDLLAADLACKTAGSPDELIAHQAALAIVDRAERARRRSG